MRLRASSPSDACRRADVGSVHASSPGPLPLPRLPRSAGRRERVGGVHESSGGSLGWPLSRVRALLPETSMDSAATIRRLAAHVSLRVDDAVVVVPRRRGRRDGPRASHARWAAYSCHHGAWATERRPLSEFPAGSSRAPAPGSGRPAPPGRLLQSPRCTHAARPIRPPSTPSPSRSHPLSWLLGVVLLHCPCAPVSLDALSDIPSIHSTHDYDHVGSRQ
jgi:hypothetical protein